MGGTAVTDVYELGQLIGCNLGQDWVDEFEDPWQAAEDWLRTTRDDRLAVLREDIAGLFMAVPDQQARYCHFQLNAAFRSADEFDVWLLAVYNRIEKALAGIHTQPLVDPQSDLPSDA